MGLLKKISNFFVKEDIETLQEKRKRQENSNKEGVRTSLFNTLLTKNDPFSRTTFPYKWSNEFLHPLERKERSFIETETLRWHELFSTRQIEDVKSNVYRYIEKFRKYEDVFEFFEGNKEIADFILTKNVSQLYLPLAKERLSELSDEDLLEWDVVKGPYSFTPNKEEYLHLIKNIANSVVVEGKEQMMFIEEQRRILIEMKQREANGEVIVKEGLNPVAATIESVLNENKNKIIKAATDKLFFENTLFPEYKGDVERPFNNELFHKYKDMLRAESFYEVMEKVHEDMKDFLYYYQKVDLIEWAREEWDKFVIFIVNYHNDLTREELEKINPTEYSPHKYALDFFGILILSIYSDNLIKHFSLQDS